MLSKLSLKAKLGVGFGSLLLILVTLGIVTYSSINELDAESDRFSGAVEKKSLAIKVEGAIEKQAVGIRGFLLRDQEDLLKHDEEGKQEYKDALDQLTKLVVTDEGKKLLADITRTQQAWRAQADHEIQLRRAGKTSDAVDLVFSPQTSAARGELRKAIADLIAYQEKRRDAAGAEQDATQAHTRWLTVGLSLGGILIGSIVAILTVRSISRGITRMLVMIEQITANDLGISDVEVASGDEIGRATAALNLMKNNLRDLIQSIAGTAEHVASASEEISSSATQQAQSSETQKDQTTQVATAMQEMSSTVLQVSDNSNKAAESARRAAETARHGGSIVDDTLTKMRGIAASVGATAKKMEELGKSSDQIGRIIGVIDDIADQTNLLALNAAIEAARAGEQGRGFAVVADEVRKLAERTTTATKEIAQMIKNIQDETKTAVFAMEEGNRQVEDGVKTTTSAGDSLKEIIHMAEEVGEMITHIATAATEQSSAAEQVNTNMDQIARLVKESAVGAQQSAKACQDLSGLALDLQKMVGNFKLGENGNSYRPGRRSAARPNGHSRALDSGAGTREATKAFAASAR